jgi:hypothetical protein
MRPDQRLDTELDVFIERVAARLRAPVPLSSQVERRVLARLRAGPAGLASSFLTGRRRPVAVLALAACLAAVFGVGIMVGRRSTPASADHGPRPVEFAFRTTADSAVAVVGDFNDWDARATPLHPASDGLWSVTVALRPGRYRYTFVVDGTRWRRDPYAPRALEDDFGAPTSVITVARR